MGCMMPKKMFFAHHEFPEGVSQQASLYVHHMTVGPAIDGVELQEVQIQSEPQRPTLLSPTSKNLHTPAVVAKLQPQLKRKEPSSAELHSFGDNAYLRGDA